MLKNSLEDKKKCLTCIEFAALKFSFEHYRSIVEKRCERISDLQPEKL